MLLEVDGLNTRWYEGVPSDYEGEMGLHDVRDVRAHVAPAVYGRMADLLPLRAVVLLVVRLTRRMTMIRPCL